MTRRAYPGLTATKKAVAAARAAGLPVAAVDSWPDGRISVRVGQPLDKSESSGDPVLDEWLKEGELTNEAHRDS